MARKGGLTPMWSDREVERWFDYFVDRAEERIYKLLQRAGEEFVKLARKKGNYQDHTGNLRSSIGYVIVKDGDILTEIVRRSIFKNKSWWLPTFIPWSVVCQTLPKTSFLSHIPVPGMMLWQNGCIGKVENRRKQN